MSLYDDIFTDEEIKSLNFDLKKLDTNPKSIEILYQAKKDYLNGKIKWNGELIDLNEFIKLKKTAQQIKTYLAYEEFVEFKSGEDRRQRLLDKLSEKRSVFINKREIKYQNLFINFNAHQLEKLYNKAFKDWNINCDAIIESIHCNGFFVTDDLVDLFRRLSTNLTEINEANLKYMIFNTDVSWFVWHINRDEMILIPIPK